MENKDSQRGKGKQVMISQQSLLPDELIFTEILTRLPVKSVVRFRSVSVKWCSTLSSSGFAKAHLEKSPFSHPCAPINTLFIWELGFHSNCFLLSYDGEVDQNSRNYQDYLVKLNFDFCDPSNCLQLIGSCNGLICISPLYYAKYFILWNPTTGEANNYVRPDGNFETCGFGYVSSVDDYKFVEIIGNSQNLAALIFSLRENRWTKIDLNYTGISFLYQRGDFVSEKLYWLATNSDNFQILVSFDLAVERFDVIEVNFDCCDSFGVLGGCLCKFSSHPSTVDILEPPAIVKSIELPNELMIDGLSEIIGFTKTDKYFVCSGRRLGIVDTCTRPIQYTLLFNYINFTQIARFVPSLVSPFPRKELEATAGVYYD